MLIARSVRFACSDSLCISIHLRMAASEWRRRGINKDIDITFATGSAGLSNTSSLFS